MFSRNLALCLMLLAVNASASEDSLAKLQKGQPKDVVRLIERLAMCAHFGGEEPYDNERRREISLAVSKLKCDRIEKDEAAARKRYAKNPRTLEALEQAKTGNY
jgi:hypothetical protein